MARFRKFAAKLICSAIKKLGVVKLIRTLINGGISGDVGGKLENLLLPGNDANYFRRHFRIPMPGSTN
jgi:hypothetical protein